MSHSKKPAQPSPRKDKKQLIKLFRFGLPLDQLQCIYLPDFGNVPIFLVETGEIIRRHVDVEGLFRKSADLSRQDELKLQAEQGRALGKLDVHEVTCLLKTFFRLLPEPLLPCLFHDPLLSSMDLPEPQRTEAVQGLCFALPALHLSCLRYFMNLLADVAQHVDMNRMNARNLAVVMTPSLIRLKVRSKLMSPEELRVLPKQTALIEHLILRADTIGCMPPQLYHHSIEMAETLLQKKLSSKKKKKKSKLMRNMEQHLGAARAALSILANLHFRPNTSTTVSDTTLVDGPYGQASSLLQNSGVNSELYVNRERRNIYRTPLSLFPGKKRHRDKHERRSRKRQRSRHCTAPPGKNECKAMRDPLVKSWSEAIPFVLNPSDNDSDAETSEYSSWSDEDSSHSDSEQEERVIADSVANIRKDDLSVATNKDGPRHPQICLISKTCVMKMEGDKAFPSDKERIYLPGKISESKWKCMPKKPIYNQGLVHSDNHSQLLKSVRNASHPHLKMAAETKCGAFSEISTSYKETPSKTKDVDVTPTIFSQFTCFLGESKEKQNQTNNGTNQQIKILQFSDHTNNSEFQQKSECSIDQKDFEPEKSDKSHQQGEGVHSQQKDEKLLIPGFLSKTEDKCRRLKYSYNMYCLLAENEDKTDCKTIEKDMLLPSKHNTEDEIECEELKQQSEVKYLADNEDNTDFKTVGSGVSLSPSGQCDGKRTEELKQSSESVLVHQLCPTSAQLSTPLASLIPPNEDVSTNLSSQPTGNLLSHLQESACRNQFTEEEEEGNTDDSNDSRQKRTENTVFTFVGMELEDKNSTRLSSPDQDQSEFEFESKEFTPIQYEVKQDQPSLPYISPVSLVSSSCQTEEFRSNLETTVDDALELFEPEYNCLGITQQPTFSDSEENVSQQLSDHVKCEGSRASRLDKTISKMQASSSVHNSVSRTNVYDLIPDQQSKLYKHIENFDLLLNDRHDKKLKPELLDERLAYEVSKSQSRFHLQNSESSLAVQCESCDCNKIDSACEENVAGELSLPNQLYKPDQRQPNYCHHFAGIGAYKGYAPIELQPQCMHHCLHRGSQNHMQPHCNLFHNVSLGFGLLQQPLNIHYYGTNLISEHVLAEERKSCAKEQYYGHLFPSVPVQVQNTSGFETSNFLHRQLYPTSYSQAVMHKPLEAFVTQENIQKQNLNYKHKYNSRWTLNENSCNCENINEKHQFSSMEMNLQALPNQTMPSGLCINEHSKNELAFETQHHELSQRCFYQRNIYPNQWNPQKCSLKQQETGRERTESSYDRIHEFQETNNCSESDQSYLKAEITHEEDCNQRDSSAGISSTQDSLKLWNDSSSTEAVASGISDLLQTRRYPGAESVIEYIKVLSENKTLWKEHPICNDAADTVTQGPCSSNCGAVPLSTRGSFSSRGTSGSPETVTDLDHTSESSLSSDMNDEYKCDFSEINLTSHPHVQKQEDESAPTWSHLNPDIPIHNSPYQIHLKSQSPQPGRKEQECLHHAPLESDASHTTTTAAEKLDKLDFSELNPDFSQSGQVFEQILGENNFSVGDTEDQMYATMTEDHSNESFIFESEDQNEMSENKNPLHKSEPTSTEANFDLEDSPARTICPHHLGDGQKGVSFDSTVVVRSKSPRKNRWKSPGTVKSLQNTDIFIMREAEEKEMFESVTEQLQMNLQESPQDNHNDNAENITAENSTDMLDTLYDASDRLYTKQPVISPPPQTPTEVSDTAISLLAINGPENISRSNTNSSNTTSVSPTHTSQTLWPDCATSLNTHLTQADSQMLHPPIPRKMTVLQDSLLIINGRLDSHGFSNNTTRDDYFHQDTDCEQSDTAPEKMEANSGAAPKTGAYLDLHTDKIIHHQETVPQVSDEVQEVCGCLAQSGPVAVPRKAYFKPDGDITLK